MEIRTGAADGPVVATVTIPATSAGAYASTTVPLSLSGLNDLFLVFRQAPGGPGNNFFNLNWVEFGGAGVGA